MKTFLMGAALCLAPLWGRGSTVVVLSADLGPYQEAFEGVKELIPDAQSVTLKDGKADVGSADAVIALGGQAALATYPDSSALVVAMVADSKVKPARPYIRVSMLPEASVLFSKMKAIQPGITSIAAFGVADSYDAYLKELGVAAQGAGVRLITRKVNQVADLVAALRAIQGQAQALWIAPDPVLISQATFKLMNDFCLANKIGLYAPAASLANTGALAGVAPTFKDIGRAAAKAASSGNASGNVSSNRCEIMVNAATASALGLNIPSGFASVGE
jgi:hypothetical protein